MKKKNNAKRALQYPNSRYLYPYLIKRDPCCEEREEKQQLYHKKTTRAILYSINLLHGPPRQVCDTGVQALLIEYTQKQKEKKKKRKKKGTEKKKEKKGNM